MLVTFVKFNWCSRWRDQRGMLQWHPGYSQHSSLLKWKHHSCRAEISLVVCYLLVFSTILNWQKVMANRCRKGIILGKLWRPFFFIFPRTPPEHPFHKSMFLHHIPKLFCAILFQQWNQSSLTSLPRLGLQKPSTHLALLSLCRHSSLINKYLAKFYCPLPVN